MFRGITVALFITLVLNQALAAKECYKCSTVVNTTTCTNPFPGVDTCVTTTNQDVNCIKYTYNLDNAIQIYRGCRVPTDTCDDVKASVQEEEGRKVIDCCLCSTDLCTCNNSTKITESTILLAAFILFILF